MCGICGFVKIHRQVEPEDTVIARKMVQQLTHRGPDGYEVKTFDNVALGFSRLGIIGLANGMQPISNEDESLILICNGEVFNYIELRQELKQKGHVFKTDSDVEVILHLFEEQGIDGLNQINGQFAFALYDKRHQQLYCARDQMGINPLYYTIFNDTFIFGSEIKAILAYPGVPRQIDKTGLDQIFTFPGIVSPRTIFKNIQSLENGHFLVLDKAGQLSDHEYWDLVFPEENTTTSQLSEKEYADRIEELLDKSIRYRLRSDVPLGTYLSGGLDSSIITTKVRAFAGDTSKHVFSIDFPDAQISETPFQELIAQQTNSILNKKTFYYEDISERLRTCIYHCETPIKETFNAATHYLSESVRNKGIKVILSGQGADEMFAGYVGYRFDKMRAMQGMETPIDPVEAAIRMKMWGDPNFIYERNFTESIRSRRELYSAELNACFDEFNCLQYPVIDTRKIQGRDIINKRSYIDFKIRLIDHLLSDFGDRMAMANSVEVRYPFLDKDLVEFATSVPPGVKLKDFNEKHILKEMARKFVPATIIDREKFGFVAPGSPYLLQHNIEYINDLLSFDRIKRQGFFDPFKIEELKKIYKQEGYTVNVPFETDYLIIVITFGILLEAFIE
ncbi:asparagine synthase (glutamine-hydrolyzing) [Chitinophaga sp.]|uniref:asparagine synthase (glutamine-hydrolyzing) n=1 Tax=Chitinophaga sp. TaxID=1869181 RepID=UPI002F93FCF8